VDVEQQRLDAETLAQAVALDKALADGVLRYAFTFHHRVDSAQTFARTLALLHDDDNRPRPFVNTVIGTMSIGARRRVLADLMAAPTGVACSAKALTEGVDAPAVDTVVFVDPKSSVVDILQAVGRALRRDPANPAKRAHIVVPVAIGNHDNPERELDRSARESVWRVLKAMRAHDEILAAHIDAEMAERGRRLAQGIDDERLSPDAVFGGRLHLWLPQLLPLNPLLT
jgi:superfamily II DNA or RNA helicase